MKSVVILAIVALCSAADVPDTVAPLSIIPFGRGPKIVNGQTATPNQFPYQALVYITKFQTTYQCGGSLISSLWVLSAAHCITDAYYIQLFFGSINRNSMPVARNGITTIHKGSYSPITLRDDIALIKMDQAVTFGSNIQAIQLPSRREAGATLLNVILIVSGFGLTTANQVSTELQYTNVIGISNAQCRSIYGSIIIPTMLCTRGYPNTNAGSCSGDSGGPLIQFTKLVGVVSFGSAQSCVNGLPQGFTRVAPYLDFISQYTGIVIRA